MSPRAAKKKTTASEPPLGIGEWRAAALTALAEGGVRAVAIEPVARALGVTKGSGYWHFASRDDLLRAALEAWEEATTLEVIARLDQIADPAERLTALFTQALGGSLDAKVLFALTAADPSPIVVAALERVASERLAFVTRCYRELGHKPTAARHRATVAYAAYLGVVTLRRQAKNVVPTKERQRLVETLCAMLI